MKKTIFIVTLLMLTLSACASPATEIPVTEATSVSAEDNAPAQEVVVTEAPMQGKLPAPSFESQTYIDEAVGFALEYPASWTVKETMTGERGGQSVLLSSPDIIDLETVPAGETRVAITVYQWDPKNDLAAFAVSRKAAWDASGFTILSEEPVTLDLGLAAVKITVQTPEGVTVPFLFAAIGDQYLSISGEGDLALVDEMMRYLRPAGNYIEQHLYSL